MALPLRQECVSGEEAAWDTRLIVHDMRTPLNALLLNLQAAALQGRLTEEQKHSLDSAEKNARVLVGLIEEVLAVHAGNMWTRESLSLQECAPEQLIADAIEQVASLAARKSIAIASVVQKSIAPIIADREKISRVLVNLLSNALKFTAHGGRITVEACPRMNDGHPAVVFSVEDNGAGISDEAIKWIFLQGVSHAAPDGERSTGLGLTVSRQIVEAHGGRIWAEPGRIDGSAFSFVLPAES